IDYLGLTGQAQFIVTPTDHVRLEPDDDIAAQFGFTLGPRVELPLRDWSKPRPADEISSVIYLTGQPGVFTGIAGHALSGTAFGYTAGGGLNLRVTDELLVGGFVRYNWVDERVTGENRDRGNISFVTTGLGLTYNVAPPPPPAVAEAPPPRHVPP